MEIKEPKALTDCEEELFTKGQIVLCHNKFFREELQRKYGKLYGKYKNIAFSSLGCGITRIFLLKGVSL